MWDWFQFKVFVVLGPRTAKSCRVIHSKAVSVRGDTEEHGNPNLNVSLKITCGAPAWSSE